VGQTASHFTRAFSRGPTLFSLAVGNPLGGSCASSNAPIMLPVHPDKSEDLGEEEDSERIIREAFVLGNCDFFSFLFLLDDPTRGETATRCEPLACELTLLPYWVYSSLPCHCCRLFASYSRSTKFWAAMHCLLCDEYAAFARVIEVFQSTFPRQLGSGPHVLTKRREVVKPMLIPFLSTQL
jgi:hypothetical protein